MLKIANIRLVFFGIILVCFAIFGCAKINDSARNRTNVTFHSPDKQEVNAALQTVELQTYKSEYQISPLDFGMADPESSSDIDCYVIFVDYPETNSGATCTGTFGSIDVDEVIGFTGIGSTASADILTGNDRRFLLAVVKSDEGCVDFFNLNENLNSTPYFVGELVQDITASTSDVALTGVLSTGSRIDDCNGGNFDSMSEPFDPFDVNGLTAWYDPTDNETVYTDSACSISASAQSGDSIGCIKNKAAANFAIQTTPSNRPTYVFEGVNTRNVLSFDGSNDFLDTQSVTTSDSGTIVIVFDTNTAPGSLTAIVGADNGSLDNISTGINPSGGISFNADGTTQSSTTVNFNDGSPHKIIYTWSNGSQALYIDGVLESSASGAVSIGNTQAFFIGAFSSTGAATAHFTGTIAEVLIYNSAISATDRDSLFSYLDSKWGF